MVPQACHWLTAGLVILPWALGTLDDELPKCAAYAMGLSIHILGGLMILAVLVIRLLWRLLDPPPPPGPTALGEWLERAGRLAHCVLYALVIAVPVAASRFSSRAAMLSHCSGSPKCLLLGPPIVRLHGPLKRRTRCPRMLW